MAINWTLRHVCEIDWYSLTTNEDREFVETPDGAPFRLDIDNNPEELISTLKFLVEYKCSYDFINMVIEAYAHKCSSVVLK